MLPVCQWVMVRYVPGGYGTVNTSGLQYITDRVVTVWYMPVCYSTVDTNVLHYILYQCVSVQYAVTVQYMPILLHYSMYRCGLVWYGQVEAVQQHHFVTLHSVPVFSVWYI